MSRTLLASAAALAAVFASPSHAVQREPTSKWNLQYTTSACTAKRAFGDYAIALTPSPFGSTMRIIMEGPGRAMRARQFKSTLDPHDGGEKIKARSLIFKVSKKGKRGLYTNVERSDADRILATGRLDIRAGHQDHRELWDNRSVRYMGADLDLGNTKALQKALDTCMEDLRQHWGMVDGKLPEPPNRTQAKGDVRTIFRGSDYPEDAVAQGSTGTAQFLLMIDKEGKVMDCIVHRTSGVASLDVMGCQVIRERAKFKPALDAEGKPTLDTYVTPPIRWVLSG